MHLLTQLHLNPIMHIHDDRQLINNEKNIPSLYIGMKFVVVFVTGSLYTIIASDYYCVTVIHNINKVYKYLYFHKIKVKP